MVLRKINAWFSLVTALLFLDHSIFHAVWMLSRGSVEKSPGHMSRIMFLMMLLHAIISIVLAFLGHKGAEKRKCNGYSNLNKPTYIQRTTGLLLLPLTVLHILGTVGVLQPPRAVHAILPPVFFAVCLIHTAISISKAFITLGIGNLKIIKILDVSIRVICILTFIADVAGFYLYLV